MTVSSSSTARSALSRPDAAGPGHDRPGLRAESAATAGTGLRPPREGPQQAGDKQRASLSPGVQPLDERSPAPGPAPARSPAAVRHPAQAGRPGHGSTTPPAPGLGPRRRPWSVPGARRAEPPAVSADRESARLRLRKLSASQEEPSARWTSSRVTMTGLPLGEPLQQLEPAPRAAGCGDARPRAGSGPPRTPRAATRPSPRRGQHRVRAALHRRKYGVGAPVPPPTDRARRSHPGDRREPTGRAPGPAWRATNSEASLVLPTPASPRRSATRRRCGGRLVHLGGQPAELGLPPDEMHPAPFTRAGSAGRDRAGRGRPVARRRRSLPPGRRLERFAACRHLTAWCDVVLAIRWHTAEHASRR